MHRKTQLQGKNVSLPSRVKAFAFTPEFALSVWILKSQPHQPCIYIAAQLYCVFACMCVALRSQTELTAPARSPLTCSLMASSRMPVLLCASSFFFSSSLARNPWQFTTKSTKATHTWICSSMPHLIWGLCWLKRKEKFFPAIKSWRNERKLKKCSAVFFLPIDFESNRLTIRSRTVSQKTILTSIFIVCKWNCLHKRPFIYCADEIATLNTMYLLKCKVKIPNLHLLCLFFFIF